MLARLRARLTYANVVATLALFLALGGTSYALTVTGRDVRDNSLTGRDVRTGSLRSSDIRDGSLMGIDFRPGQLPRGEKGDKGDAGERGPAGATNVVVRFGPQGHGDCFENCAGEYETGGLARCHAGERATGGGVTPPDHLEDAVVIDTAPTPTTGTPTGWIGSIRFTIEGDSAAIPDPTVWVVCASP